MKTRRTQRGGVKVNSMNALNALTKRMGSLRFGTKRTAPRFGAKSMKHAFPKRSVLRTVIRNSKQPTKTLRSFVRNNLTRRTNRPFKMEDFEPADYLRKVGKVFEGLGDTRSRIESSKNAHFLDDFDIIIANLYEGLPIIQTALGTPTNESMNRSEDSIESMLEMIETVGEALVQTSKTYHIHVRTSRTNVSEEQLHLIAIAEAVNAVLIQSVAELAPPKADNANVTMNRLISTLGAMNVKESSANDLTSLFAGLGV